MQISRRTAILGGLGILLLGLFGGYEIDQSQKTPQKENKPSTPFHACYNGSFDEMKIVAEKKGESYDNYMGYLKGVNGGAYDTFRGTDSISKKPILQLMSNVKLQDASWKTVYEKIAQNSTVVRAIKTYHCLADITKMQIGVSIFDEAHLDHALYLGDYIEGEENEK